MLGRARVQAATGPCRLGGHRRGLGVHNRAVSDRNVEIGVTEVVDLLAVDEYSGRFLGETELFYITPDSSPIPSLETSS
jgi:hypothetical protein